MEVVVVVHAPLSEADGPWGVFNQYRVAILTKGHELVGNGGVDYDRAVGRNYFQFVWKRLFVPKEGSRRLFATPDVPASSRVHEN